VTARRPSRTQFPDLRVSDADFREACCWFGISPERFAERLVKARLDREIEVTQKKVARLLERIKADPGDLANFRLFDQLARLNAKLDALFAARWAEPAPKSAPASTTPGEES
jgi:hypothetical protein